jgi:hypothetical protein
MQNASILTTSTNITAANAFFFPVAKGNGKKNH